MKTVLSLLTGGFVLLTTVNTSHAFFSVGSVFCDANTNGVIDQGDSPVPGVVVVVTNISGTFAASAVTHSDGSFSAIIPDGTDTYVSVLLAASLPPGATAVLPAFAQFTTSPQNSVVTNFFLIQSTDCAAIPPAMTNRCWLSGGGSVGTAGKATQRFGGAVFPGCKAVGDTGGHWNATDFTTKLHFSSVSVLVVGCGNLPGLPPGSGASGAPINYIDFIGGADLVGIGGNKANYGAVYYVARAVDLGAPGKGRDQFYLRAFDRSGQTLMLISSNPSDPSAIAPVPLSAGNLRLHISGCDKPLK